MELTNRHLTRQSDLIPMGVLSAPITVIGAGAIGSFVVLSLAKMGFENITVFDDDKIEIENMSSQFYRWSDIGWHKAIALKDLVHSFTGVNIEAYAHKYTGDKTFNGIVVSAVDSMSARKLIWDAHDGISVGTLIIDPRMGAEMALMYAMNPTDEKDRASYIKTLYTDENAVAERCTAKATMYTALMLSGLVAKTVKDYVVSGNYPRVVNWSIAENQFLAFKKSP